MVHCFDCAGHCIFYGIIIINIIIISPYCPQWGIRPQFSTAWYEKLRKTSLINKCISRKTQDLSHGAFHGIKVLYIYYCTLYFFTLYFFFFLQQNNLDYVDPQIANLLFEAGQSSTNICWMCNFRNKTTVTDGGTGFCFTNDAISIILMALKIKETHKGPLIKVVSL